MNRCRCGAPDLAPTAEGIWYCSSCGERVEDRREELRDRTLVALVRRLHDLEAQVDELKSNGARRNGRHGNGQPAQVERLFEEVGGS